MLERRPLEQSVLGAILLWDEASQTLIPTAWRGLGDWVSTTRFGLGDGAAGAAARLREGVVVEDYRNGTLQEGAVPDEASPTSVMAVPVVYQDRLTGVLTANRFGVVESFNRHDLELLEVFGTQAAVAASVGLAWWGVQVIAAIVACAAAGAWFVSRRATATQAG